MSSTERTPLLPDQDRSTEDGIASEIPQEDQRTIVRLKRWFIRNFIPILCMAIITVAIVVFAVIAFTVRRPSHNEPGKPGHGHKHNRTHEVCMTPACIHASSSILESLTSDDHITPCDDFETFVCGGWRDEHDLRADQRQLGELSLMDERSSKVLRQLLESDYESDSAHSSFSPAALQGLSASLDKQNFKKMKDAYTACMDETAIAKRGLEPLLQIVKSLQSIYPSSSSNELVSRTKSKITGPRSNLTEAIIYLQELGLSAFIDAGVGADDKDPDTQVLVVSNPRRIGLRSKEEYQDKDVVKQYTKTIAEMLKLLSDGRIESYESVASGVVELEKRLSTITPSEEEANDPLHYYNPRTIVELQAMTPSVNFITLLDHFSPTYTPQRAIVMSPHYMSSVNEIIDATSREVIQGYLSWKAIYALSGRLDSQAVEPITKFKDFLQGTSAQPERWRTCVRIMDSDMSWILGRFFIEKAFSQKAKEFGDRIIYDIKDEFSARLDDLDWFDKSAAKLAKEKVRNIVQKIGYPDRSPNITDPAVLHKYYADVEISAKSFFENSISVTKDEVRKSWAKLGKPTDRFEWDMTPSTVNAYYNPPGNEIVFPAGIMQVPVFSLDLPEYISYGAFASVAGHELSHAFDSTGRHYDTNGNLTDWWPKDTVKEFEKRAECFVKQFSEFSVEGPNGERLHVNGRLTLGENIADAGGVNAAFKAWKKRDAAKPDLLLPGLSDRFTKEQLFFISYGRTWCSKIRPQAAIDRVRTDPHSPAFARVLGTMANAPAFLDAFQCSKRKPRCELW